MANKPDISTNRGTGIRAIIGGACLLSLQACATTPDDRAAIGDAVPELAMNSATAQRKPARKPGATGYSDPVVVNVADAPATASATAAPPLQTAADAGPGDLVMQPTAINAGRSSIFAPQQTGATVDVAAASTNTSASIVPAEMPTRRVSPMSSSLFSAPQPVSYQEEALPVEAVSADPRQQDVTTNEAPSETAPSAEDTLPPYPATDAVENDAAPKTKKRFPTLARLLGRIAN
ncbi:MAG TPA: hypothetical protein DIC56_12745 [Rhizobium sp.]|nr:hypothetical protein [Rhizobium sp.]